MDTHREYDNIVGKLGGGHQHKQQKKSKLITFAIQMEVFVNVAPQTHAQLINIVWVQVQNI